MEEEFKILPSTYNNFTLPDELNYVTVDDIHKNITKYQLIQQIKGLEEEIKLSTKKREKTKEEYETLNKNLPKMEIEVEERIDTRKRLTLVEQNKKTAGFHDIKLFMDKVD